MEIRRLNQYRSEPVMFAIYSPIKKFSKVVSQIRKMQDTSNIIAAIELCMEQEGNHDNHFSLGDHVTRKQLRDNLMGFEKIIEKRQVEVAKLVAASKNRTDPLVKKIHEDAVIYQGTLQHALFQMQQIYDNIVKSKYKNEKIDEAHDEHNAHTK